MPRKSCPPHHRPRPEYPQVDASLARRGYLTDSRRNVTAGAKLQKLMTARSGKGTNEPMFELP